MAVLTLGKPSPIFWELSLSGVLSRGTGRTVETLDGASVGPDPACGNHTMGAGKATFKALLTHSRTSELQEVAQVTQPVMPSGSVASWPPGPRLGVSFSGETKRERNQA